MRLENLLEASNDISSDELKPVNAFGQAVSARTRALHQTQDLQKEASTAPELDVDSEAVARRIARLAKAATKQQQALQQPTAPVTAAGRRASRRPHLTTLRACRRSAAAPASAPETLPVEAHSRMLHLAGQLLRESLLGPEGEQPQPAGAAQPVARDLPERRRATCCPRSIVTASRN